MDDSCAVCAEPLEWVAYGACGHRDVCSTCVSRLRFICNDSQCCICKTENSVVFVTKALGEYTRLINDFSVFPSEPREGRLGTYWYHEDTQAFFDDVDHYRMIRAMCKLSCSTCDKAEDRSNDALKRHHRFRNIEQLKGHLFHQHKLLMCSLCLEGRKVFVCEQKLYTWAQLNRHISTGDSEVDGAENERGGFSGHPMCEFCRTPFYGDNELYLHMSTEHYTCFICQRQHPGQYEYFKNYDDLEIHFRHEHFLCEDGNCLLQKFIVFQSETEMKRHNALEHGGRMSRAKRNAALQIPTSFRYNQSSEQDRWRVRGQTFRQDFADDQISAAIQASLEYSNADLTRPDQLPSSAQMIPNTSSDISDTNTFVQTFEALNMEESEQPSRYLQALGQDYSNTSLQEAAFPPLIGSSSSHHGAKRDSEVLRHTMADHLRRQKNSRSLANGRQQNATGRPTTSTSLPPTDTVAAPAPLGMGSGSASSSYASLAKVHALGRATAALRVKSASPSRSNSGTNGVDHYASTPNPAETELDSSSSDFPPISAAIPKINQTFPKVENVKAANKSLVEKIRTALNNDGEKYTSFKEISALYRQGSVDTEMYLDYVRHFGLSHLIFDLARLCPEPEKQKELLETYKYGARKNGWGQGSSNGTKKGKGKLVNPSGSNPNMLAERIMDTVRDLQSDYKSAGGEVEILEKDGYRTKGKSKVNFEGQHVAGQGQPLKVEKRVEVNSADAGVNQNLGDRAGEKKKKKKTSKFHRIRLGEGSTASFLDLRNSDQDGLRDPVDDEDENSNSRVGLPLRGVWQKGGGQKLLF
ncbi:hypothetical protein SAY86_023552 [Trapa natans]|uniref:RING-type E3 ubiquitin transferase n=1 Tax=Trapa natans TaxID=22666 RepID=A0AAN7M7D4_TRANT|nr:hypothetical protein SAY86_023552 [Trapa natans]